MKTHLSFRSFEKWQRMGILSLLSLALWTGCATNELVLKESDLVPLPDAATRTHFISEKTFAVTTVQDQRERAGNWVGTVRTGVGNEPTPVELERPVAQVVRTQFEKELQARGFHTATSPQPEINLQLFIQKLEVSETPDRFKPEASICDARIQVEASRSGNPTVMKWTGKANFQSPGTVVDTTVNTAPTLAGCLNLIVEQLVTNPDFRSLVSSNASAPTKK